MVFLLLTAVTSVPYLCDGVVFTVFFVFRIGCQLIDFFSFFPPELRVVGQDVEKVG